MGLSCGKDVQGETHFAFTVVPAADLVTPTSAVVTVNFSQALLLRGAADHITAMAGDLKRQLGQESSANVQYLLQTSVRRALDDLGKTEAEYKKEADLPASASAVDVFFDDIRANYKDALDALLKDSARSARFAPELMRVNLAAVGAPSPLSHGSEAVLESILHHARAFEVAASSRVMTFNLDVYSEPTGATISYRQRLDPPGFKPLDHTTDWHIPNVYHATYLVKFQKSGYVVQTLTFNGGENSSTSITAHVVRKGRTQ
jgi:hypothetical protein